MKKIHIVLLLLVAAGIASLTIFLKDLTISTTFTNAQTKYKDKFVHIATQLDTSTYEHGIAFKDANNAIFYAKDSTGLSTKVIYKKELPQDFEKSFRLLLKGYMRDTYFECKEIQLKCPSKMKDAETVGSK